VKVVSLQRVVDALGTAQGGCPDPSRYRIPRRWLPGLTADPSPDEPAVYELSPRRYFQELVDWILAQPDQTPPREPDWSRKAVVYNLFVRHASAFDHDGDGCIGGAKGEITCNAEGVRETGTFLKTMALLPYLRRLGVNTLYLLPITAVGRHGRKGELGSPYAIRNPERLEPTLADPLLGDLPLEDQFAALVEASHRLGMRVVLEFVFRTASLDADWIDEHPEWFYWIDRAVANRRPGMADPAAGFGAPVFSREDLARIYRATTRVGRGSPLHGAELSRHLRRTGAKMVPPPAAFRAWFGAPPSAVARRSSGEVVGEEAGSGRELRIPPAFADWPPDDAQPPWSDVTYLRMYRHKCFNYMAYNTIRVYDPDLARPENAVEALWKRIRGIVPAYQRRYGIDGVMIDMGHALPAPLAAAVLADARAADPSVAFWEENFALSSISRRNGYDAVVGGLIFAAHRVEQYRDFIDRLRRPAPVGFFAAVENHNTPRAAARPAGTEVGFAAWVAALFLPGAIPFLHAGFELEAREPLNTGLDFAPDELAQWQEGGLALFDRAALPWATPTSLPQRVAEVLEIRRRYAPALAAGERPTVEQVATVGRAAIAFRVEGGAGELLLAASLDGDESALVALQSGGVDLLSGAVLGAGELLLLGPGQWRIVALGGARPTIAR
jgi:hypothetical protein